MGYSLIQDKIVEKLGTLTNLKNIKENRPRIIDPGDFETEFGAELDTDGTIKRIHTWIVQLEGAMPLTPPGLTSLSTYHTTYRFSISGFLNFTSTSEALIRDYAEEIMQAFAPYKSLGLNADPTTPVIDSTITIDAFSIEDFGPVSCSAVKLTVTATAWTGRVEYT